jgi:succinate dehydrogenase/fumarate reductase flavoprotein subunit
MEENKESYEHLTAGQMKTLSTRMKQIREENYLEQSRKRLDKIVSTKMKTSFIGALSAFEKEFGFLWGVGKEYDELTEEEKDMEEIWERVRTSVLNNGNAQLRATQNEIANNVIKWNRYRIDFIVQEN